MFNKRHSLAYWAGVAGIIAAVFAGCQVLLAFIQYFFPPPSSPGPTLIITAAPFTTTSTPANNNNSSTPLFQTTPVSQSANSSEKIRSIFPWIYWITNLVTNLPKDTWTILLISIGIFFLFLGGGYIFLIIHSSSRVWFLIANIFFGFYISINLFGWWGVLSGFLIMSGLVVIVSTFSNYEGSRILGGMIGAVVGVFGGTALSLFYLAIPGPFIPDYITSGTIIGLILGICLGFLFKPEIPEY